MNKRLSVLGICAVILLIVFSSGCFEDDNSDKKNDGNKELDKFIGTWVGEWDWGNNLTSNETWTFYTNRTIKIVDEFGVDWGTYELEDGKLKIKIPTPTENHPDAAFTMWYEYEFSNGDNQLTLISSTGKMGKFTRQG